MDPTAFVYMGLSGEQTYGKSTGAVIVDNAKGHAKYTLLGDIQPPEVCTPLTEQVTKNTQNLYIVQVTAEHLHVFAYPREQALRQLKDGSLPMPQSTN